MRLNREKSTKMLFKQLECEAKGIQTSTYLGGDRRLCEVGSFKLCILN